MNTETSRTEAAVGDLDFLEREPARLAGGKDDTGRPATGLVYGFIGAATLWTIIGFGLALYLS